MYLWGPKSESQFTELKYQIFFAGGKFQDGYSQVGHNGTPLIFYTFVCYKDKMFIDYVILFIR